MKKCKTISKVLHFSRESSKITVNSNVVKRFLPKKYSDVLNIVYLYGRKSVLLYSPIKNVRSKEEKACTRFFMSRKHR